MSDNEINTGVDGGYLPFSSDSSNNGNSSRHTRDNHFRGKQFNRSKFGFGYNPQQNQRHTPYQNKRQSFGESPGNRQQNQRIDHGENYSIKDYIHPSMVEDPWEHLCKRKNVNDNSFVSTTEGQNRKSAEDIDEDLAKPLE